MKDKFGGWYRDNDCIEYQIQRERTVTCFGFPGYVIEWDVVASFDNAEDRDKALAKRRDNTRETYRAHDYDPRLNRAILR